MRRNIGRIVTIWVPEELLRDFDRIVKRDGFRSRSDAIVYLMRLYVDCRKSWFRKILDKFLKML